MTAGTMTDRRFPGTAVRKGVDMAGRAARATTYHVPRAAICAAAEFPHVEMKERPAPSRYGPLSFAQPPRPSNSTVDR